MGATSSVTNVCLLLTAACLVASCEQGSRDGRPSASRTPCPALAAGEEPTRLVRAKFSPIELRLPEDSFRSRDFNDELRRGEGWMGSAGLVVGYAVRAEPAPMRYPSAGYYHVVDCSERIGGRMAVVRMHYSAVTTVPGQYVVATWSLGRGEALVVNTFHPDSSRRGDLLQVVRSVRFQE